MSARREREAPCSRLLWEVETGKLLDRIGTEDEEGTLDWAAADEEMIGVFIVVWYE